MTNAANIVVTGLTNGRGPSFTSAIEIELGPGVWFRATPSYADLVLAELRKIAERPERFEAILTIEWLTVKITPALARRALATQVELELTPRKRRRLNRRRKR